MDGCPRLIARGLSVRVQEHIVSEVCVSPSFFFVFGQILNHYRRDSVETYFHTYSLL